MAQLWRLPVVFASVIALAAVGISDDVRPMTALARLLLQAIAVAMTVAVLPDGMRILESFRLWITAACSLASSGLWNVVIYDGIDWITAAEVVPVTAGLTLFGPHGRAPRRGGDADSLRSVRRHDRFCAV